MTSLRPPTARHVRAVGPLRIGWIGEPDADGTDPVASRLVGMGHTVVPLGAHRIGRSVAAQRPTLTGGRGALQAAFLSSIDQIPLLPLLRARGIPVAVHVDGVGRGDHARTHRWFERLAIREADALLTATRTAEDHYEDRFGIPTQFVGRGAPVVSGDCSDLDPRFRLVSGAYHLVVSSPHGSDRSDLAVEAYHRSAARLPLAVAGAIGGGGPGAASVRQLAARDPRIRLLGPVPEPWALDGLHAHAFSYLQSDTAPRIDDDLLRAMGAGSAVVVHEHPVNREVVGTAGTYCSTVMDLARAIDEMEDFPFRFRDIGDLMQERVARLHDWDVVAERYATVASKLARGFSTRGMRSGGVVARAASPSPVTFDLRRG